MLNTLSSVSVRESRIQYLCDPQWFRDTASRGPTTIAAPESQFRTCPSDHGPFNPYIPIRSTIIGKSRVAKDPIAMHTSWRSNSDIASVTSIGYPRMSASGESSTTMHRLLHASGHHPIPPPNDPNVGTRRSDQTKRFDEIVQQQVTVAKSMRVNTTVACDWLNFEFQSLRLILVAAGSRRANTRINEEAPRCCDWILVATGYHCDWISLRLESCCDWISLSVATGFLLRLDIIATGYRCDWSLVATGYRCDWSLVATGYRCDWILVASGYDKKEIFCD
ncbi:hypothetical protein F511_33222 [Dorcoceras hygrometricum]|uniref:Uncharacterized protein n=1 Tax=Dorcoceras hygrometricum TaxID=472368 RepID=A0A2Z7CYV0_9LAMI|nr:hypothetical protein F511_33222 [Dorcoceras hygrometricum]